MMKVLHCIKATRISGAERHLLILLSALRGRDVDAQLVLLVEPQNLMTEMVDLAEKRGIPTQRLIIRQDLDLLVIRRLKQMFQAAKPDVVHTHLSHADAHGLPAARWAGVPVVITGRHNDDAFRRRAVVRWLNRQLWGRVTAGIAISESIRRFAIEVEGAPPPKVRVVPYGFEYSPLKPDALREARTRLQAEQGLAADSLLVGMACRLVEQKGVIYGLRAFRQIADEFPNAYVLIAGDGELRAALEQEAGDLAQFGRVRFLGWREDVPGLMAGLDIFLMPSLWEGFGLVLLEAMSKQLPIVASRVSAIPEVVIHGETGLLAPPRDVEGFAEALRALLPDRSLRAYMGMNGEDRLEQHFSAVRMAEQTRAVYEEFLKKDKNKKN